MPSSPIPHRTDFLERDRDGKLTGKVNRYWILWLMELSENVPEDPNALLSLTIQESQPVGSIEDIADQAALSSSLDTPTLHETQIEELAGGVALALDDPIPSPVIPAYGGMYYYSLAGATITIAVAAADVFYMVDTGLFTMITNLMEFQNDRELKILYPGYYSVDWHISVECTSADQEIESSLMINGSEQTQSAAHSQTGPANRPVSMGGTWVGYLAQDDLVQLSVLNHTAANDIEISHLSLAVTRLGD